MEVENKCINQWKKYTHTQKVGKYRHQIAKNVPLETEHKFKPIIH